MKRLLIFLFLINGINFNCITQNIKEDSVYFLLGTMEDYIGRHIHDSSQLDHYWGDDSKFVYIIDTILKKMNYEPISDTNEPSIYCYEIAKKINSFYSDGKLNDNIFINQNQKYLFIAGAYFRHGQKRDSLYRIRIANSWTKWKVCYSALNDIDCDSVYIQHESGIPGHSNVYFKPRIKLLKYLESVEPLKYDIRKNYVKKLKRMLGEEKYEKIKYKFEWK